MADTRTLEEAIFDIEADVTVLSMLNNQQPLESGWQLYDIIAEPGFDLLRIPCSESMAIIMALKRLRESLARATHFYRCV